MLSQNVINRAVVELLCFGKSMAMSTQDGYQIIVIKILSHRKG